MKFLFGCRTHQRRTRSRADRQVVLFLSLAILSITCRADETVASPAGSVNRPSTQARRVGELSNVDVTESSGLGRSHRSPGIFWTHNDSGDLPRLFAFDAMGKHLGECRLRGAQAIDWEDMASFAREGRNWLLLADVGDNARRRKHCTLYVCEEPPVEATEADCRAIHFQYEDGPQDCEAVGVDPELGVAVLISKVGTGSAKVYELPLRDTSEPMLIARQSATIAIPFITSMDIAGDCSQAIVMTYADAFVFARQANETWGQAFARSPSHVSLPLRRQGEAICYGSTCSLLYLTSEKRPTPLWEVRLVGE